MCFRQSGSFSIPESMLSEENNKDYEDVMTL